MKNKRVKIRLSVLVFAITTFIIAIANPAIALNSQQYGIDSSFLAELQSKEMPDYDRPEAIEKGLVVENGHVARLYKKESDLRTVIFANKDGTETAYIFDEPVKYIDENGKIVDKSNRLYSVYADEYAYVNWITTFGRISRRRWMKKAGLSSSTEIFRLKCILTPVSPRL